MRKIRWFGLLVFYILTWEATAQHKVLIPSVIKEVQVFLTQAQIIREATINASQGEYEWVISNLSPQIIPSSIEVNVPNGVQILGISVQENLDTTLVKPIDILAMEDTLVSYKQLWFGLESDKESVQLQKELLLANKLLGGSTGVKAEELEDVLAIYETKLSEFKNRRIKLDEETRLLKLKIDILEAKLEAYAQGKLSLNKQLSVVVKVNESIQQGKISIQYRVSEVGWTPFYDVHVGAIGGAITFVLKAKIVQGTGEDWKDVKLQVGGNNPSEMGVLPELSPQYIGLIEPMLRGKKQAASLDKIQASAAMELQVAEDGRLAAMVQTATAVSFDVRVPYSIPSDRNEHQVELTRFDVSGNYYLWTVPKISEEVYIQVKTGTNELLSQVNGEANVYYNGTYSGTTYIQSQAEDSVKMMLGKERRLQVKREKLKGNTSKSTFGSNRKDVSAYAIQLVNTSNTPMMVEVLDQIPVSTNEDIQVELLQAEGADYKSATGILTWKLHLAPKEEKKVNFEFEVIYPQNKLISPY